MQDVFSPSYRHKRSADALARRALARAARLHTVSAQVACPAAELHLPGSVALPAADPCHGAAHSTAVHPDNTSSVASSAADPCVHNTVPGGILTTVALQAAELNFSTLVASSAAIASCVDACSGDAHPIGTGLPLSNVMSVASSAADSCPNNSNCMNSSKSTSISSSQPLPGPGTRRGTLSSLHFNHAGSKVSSKHLYSSHDT